jgi:hypothetical protein
MNEHEDLDRGDLRLRAFIGLASLCSVSLLLIATFAPIDSIIKADGETLDGIAWWGPAVEVESGGWPWGLMIAAGVLAIATGVLTWSWTTWIVCLFTYHVAVLAGLALNLGWWRDGVIGIGIVLAVVAIVPSLIAGWSRRTRQHAPAQVTRPDMAQLLATVDDELADHSPTGPSPSTREQLQQIKRELESRLDAR